MEFMEILPFLPTGAVDVPLLKAPKKIFLTNILFFSLVYKNLITFFMKTHVYVLAFFGGGAGVVSPKK